MLYINPSNAELNPICHLLALLGTHYIFHVSGIRVNNCPTKCNTKQSIYYSASSLKLGLKSLNLATLEEGSCAKNISSTGGCSYSFVYS